MSRRCLWVLLALLVICLACGRRQEKSADEVKVQTKDYSAKKLAEDLGTNTRYVSAVVNVRFHTNYSSFVNKFRIEEAMTILTDKRYRGLKMEEVSDMVGFSNRQSFYASFYKFMKMTPREYRIKHSVKKTKSKEKKNE